MVIEDNDDDDDDAADYDPVKPPPSHFLMFDIKGRSNRAMRGEGSRTPRTPRRASMTSSMCLSNRFDRTGEWVILARLTSLTSLPVAQPRSLYKHIDSELPDRTRQLIILCAARARW